MKNIFLIPTDKETNLVRVWNDVEKTKFTLKVGGEVNDSFKEYVNIYITNTEKIADGEYGLCVNLIKEGYKANQAVFRMNDEQREAMVSLGGQEKAQVLKVVLTNDKDLIEDGVQKINDEFLEWFIKNPSCEFVEVESILKAFDEQNREIDFAIEKTDYTKNVYQIIIPKEEHTPCAECLDSPNLDCGFHKEEVERGVTITHVGKQKTLEEDYRIFLQKKYNNPYLTNNELHLPSFEFGAKWQAEQDKNLYSEEDVKEAFSDGWMLRDGALPFPKAKKEWFEQFSKLKNG